MNSTHQLPTTNNPSWGFWGTLGAQAKAGWPLAMVSIANATGLGHDAAREFLDSRFGRHFADDAQSHMHAGAELPQAIALATQQWMAWRISRDCSKCYGIPRGLPYLTGMVGHAPIGQE